MKQHIAIIVQNLKGGGAERAGANLSIILSEHYQVHLIIFDGTDQAYAHGGTLHVLDLPPKAGKLGKALQFIKRVRAIKNIKKEHNIACTISLMEGANLVNILARHHDKVLVSIRNHLSTLSNNPTVSTKHSKVMMQFIARAADQVIAVAYDVMVDCVEHWGMPREKVIEIPNLCDYKRLNQASGDNISLDGAGQNFVTMGRLTTQKGQGNLLRSFAQVVKTHPDAKLYLLGDGPLKPQLETLAQELGIAQQVVFVGYVHNPHDYIKACDVFVMPSLAEGMSNALLEALAFGMPCIATDCLSGMREILSPEMPEYKGVLPELELATYGMLTSVKTENVLSTQAPLCQGDNQLSQAMTLMLDNQAMAKAYREKALERIQDFAPQAIVKRWIDVIES